MKSTDEKLRELVASWTWRSRVFESDYEHEQGKSNAYLMCADELLSILDIQSVREGVSDEMVDAYVNAVNEHLGSLSEDDWESDRKDKHAHLRRVARIGLIAAMGEKS